MQAKHAPAANNGRRSSLLIYLSLAVTIIVVHAGALFDEARHDDHLHRENLRSMGWGWNDLIESTTFELPGRQLHLWWQSQPIQWRYPRPVAMAVLKAEFTLCDGDPLVLHAFGLAWHWLNCVLVLHLAQWVFQSWRWAILAAGVFAISPHSVVAASWTAAHNVLVSTALLLAAVLLYIRSAYDAEGAPIPTRFGPLCTAIGFWAAALFAREAAIVFPLLAIALDLCYGGRTLVLRRWRIYGALALLAAAYVAWRMLIFPRGGMPTGYLQAPAGLEYVWWALNKYVQTIGVLLTQLPLYAPLDYFNEWTPAIVAIHVGLLALVALTAVVYARGTHGEPGRWFGPLWIVIGLLPVVPIATSPHFAYAPFVGNALAAGFLLRGVPARWRVTTAVVTLAFLGCMFALQRCLVRMQLRTEQLVIANVVESTSRPNEGSTLFFIDQPVSTTFSVIALREAWGLDDLTGYALTTSYTHESRLPTRIARTGQRTLELTCDPPGWFSQPFDRWLLKLGGRNEAFRPGATAKTELFDVTVLESDGVGVTHIRFDFHDTLDRPDWLFFAAGRGWPMQRLTFDAPPDPAADAAAAAVFDARHAGWLAERNPLLALRRWLRPDAR